MAAPSNTVWGSIVNSKAKLGISVTATSTTNTSVTLNVQVWLALKYNISDTSNQYYFTYTNDSGSSVTNPNGTSLSLKFGTSSGSGWAESSQKQLGSYSLTYTRGTSAKTVNFSSKLNGLASDGYNVSASTSYSVPAKPSYTISYNANGGSGAPASQTKWYGTNLTLSTVKPTRTGYSFSKWNTAANGSGTSYNSGATYSANAAATLYAQWTANTYAVTFDANGGSGAPANQTKTYGVDLTLSSTIPTRTNYNFLGWAATSTATTPIYSAGAKYTSNAAITLYAVWELAYIKPRITNFTADRCDQNGTASDTGTYALVKFDWACDQDVTNVRIEWKVSSASSYSSDNGKDISSSGRSGSVNEVVGNGELSAEYTYNIRVGVADSSGSNSTVKNLNPMILPLDILVGGTGVAIGKPATLNETFDVSWNTKLNGDIAIDGSIGGERVNVSTDMYFAHGYGIYGQNADNVERSLMHINASNQYVFGYGGYSNSEGTSIYYGNEVSIRSKGAIAITSPTAGLNARQYGVNKVLWSGGAYMNSSQTAPLSEAISAQPNGIVLVFSRYDSNAVVNDHFSSHFVPKGFISSRGGSAWMDFMMTTYNYYYTSVKYLLISDTVITGHSANMSNGAYSGVTYNNSYYVLRYVIGV